MTGVTLEEGTFLPPPCDYVHFKGTGDNFREWFCLRVCLKRQIKADPLTERDQEKCVTFSFKNEMAQSLVPHKSSGLG